MLRVSLKDKEYFVEYIKKNEESLEEYIELLNDKRVLKERLYLLKNKIFEIKLETIIAKYSRGDEVDIVRNDLKNILESWKEVCNLDWIEYYYTENLWLISLAVLLEISNDILEDMRRKFREENINDWLLNFLLSSGEEQPDQIEGELLVSEKYQTVKDAICTSDKKLLVHYLEKEWYHNYKDYGWYDSHKLTRRDQRIYFGYWCFEAGAVVKLLKWEDSDIKEQQYYPYDLVHFKM